MIDRSHAEAAKYRIAVAALHYDPEMASSDPGYTIDEDLDWCLAGLAGLPAGTLPAVRAAAAAAIIDPTAHRQRVVHVLDELAGDAVRETS